MDDSTIERRLENLLSTVEHDMRVAFRDAAAQAAGKGSLQSGSHLMTKAKAVGEAMTLFVTAATSDVDAVQWVGGSLPYLYDTAAAKLIQLKLRGMEDIRKKAEAWAGPSALAAIDVEVERRYTAARGQLDDHRSGFGRATPHNPSINIQAGSGAIVQTNSPGAWAQVNINVQAIRPSLDDLEQSLPWATLGQSESADIRAEIDTIRAQLGKLAPSSVIVQESGRSLRAIVENLAASAAQPFVWAGAAVLWRALGISG